MNRNLMVGSSEVWGIILVLKVISVYLSAKRSVPFGGFGRALEKCIYSGQLPCWNLEKSEGNSEAWEKQTYNIEKKQNNTVFKSILLKFF